LPANWFPIRGQFAGFLPLFFGDIGVSAGTLGEEEAVATGWQSGGGCGTTDGGAAGCGTMDGGA